MASVCKRCASEFEDAHAYNVHDCLVSPDDPVAAPAPPELEGLASVHMSLADRVAILENDLRLTQAIVEAHAARLETIESSLSDPYEDSPTTETVLTPPPVES